MDGNYLQLNFVNLITVCLMVAVGVTLIGGVNAAIQSFVRPGASDE